ncbi:TPA: hypothetical protein GRI80_00440 [Vibrio parahaemolyticus]|uniref:Ig-like domain-containing protein n=1 Tax=Vibrio harveyi group TaxID=717610 RepID=UPI000467CD03|nr:Ig-like domain-containing protein [Vibrio parahaemolyticus]HBK5924150.1 Ig-like domain-containing protein [Vibrio alginolyticus]AWA89274.1 hypothetical protein BSG32_09485 [Vibrio parahaemolyticus]EGQ9757825.1 hypothetical protein [Vibrio parahaemolyticus]EGR0931032.1 hypothetical protein [Vibrio parahaemolyticus]EGR1344559.1 hypothetical protein [Vibrio parahaemolyticus]
MSYFVHIPFQRGMVAPPTGSGSSVISPVSVTINETISSLNVGDSGLLTATVYYSDSSQVNSSDAPNVVNWSSSDATVMSIDTTGNYEAVSPGTASIIVQVSSDSSIQTSTSIEVSSAKLVELYNFGIFDEPESDGGNLVYDTGYSNKQPWLTVEEYENNMSDLGNKLIAQAGDVVYGGVMIFSSELERAIVSLYKRVEGGYELVLDSGELSGVVGINEFHLVEFSVPETVLEEGEQYFLGVMNTSSSEEGAAVVSSRNELSNKYPPALADESPALLLDSEVDSTSLWSRAAIFKISRDVTDWHSMTAARIVDGEVNGFNSSHGSIVPSDVNGGTIIALEASTTSNWIRVTVDTAALGKPFAAIYLEYKGKQYVAPFTTGFRYELHDTAKTSDLFNALEQHIGVESKMQIIGLTSESYDFSLGIGTHSTASTENSGFKSSWAMGSCNGEFPVTKTQVDMLYASSGLDADSNPQFKIFFGTANSEKWFSANAVILKITFEDSTEITTPSLPWVSSKYQIIDASAQAVFDALTAKDGQSVVVHVEADLSLRTKDF